MRELVVRWVGLFVEGLLEDGVDAAPSPNWRTWSAKRATPPPPAVAW